MKQKILALAASLAVGVTALAGTAFASTPVLTVTQNGSNANIVINSASSNSLINLYERQTSSSWTTAASPGSTDGNGNFSGNVPITWDGSTNALQFYVSVNSQTSNVSQLVPPSSGGGLTFSNQNPVLSAGQNIAVSISSSNGSSSSYYLSNNSNSAAVNTSLSGSVLTLYGQTQGTATLNICQNITNMCGSLVVTVNSSGGSSGILTITPSSLTSLSPGQNAAVTVSNATGSIYVSSNPAPADITTGINGNTVTVYALADGTGTLSICDQGSGQCGSLYVSISGVSNTPASSGLTLGTTNPVLTIGQTQNINIFASSGSNTFAISGNTNPGVVSANINGSLLYVVGLAAGTGTVTVCQSGTSYCSTAFVTVNATTGSGLSFSQTTVNINPSQSATVIINSGSGSYYLSGNTNPSAAPATVSGSNIYISGSTAGSASITVCQTGNSSLCGSVSVTVGQTGSNLTFSNQAPALTSGQSQTVAVYSPSGYSGSFSIQNNTNPAAAGASLNGSVLTLTGNGTGSSVLTVCETGTTVCGTITAATANATTSSGTSVYMTNTNIPSMTLNQFYNYQIQAQGGSGGYVFTISAGSLPAGLTMTTTGLITGTPTSAVASPFTLKVSDSAGGTSTINLNISIVTIAPVVTTPSGLSVPASTPAATAPATPASGYQSGELISENGTIYIVYQNTKTGFTNAPAFLGLGFNFSNVTPVTSDSLVPSGKVVVTADGAHPRGTWLLSGSTVYFLTPSGLIPVPDWATFTGNGGQASYIVPANSYDLGYTKLPQMTANDSRVHG